MLTFIFLLHHSGTGCLAILCRRKKTSETFVNVDAEGQILVKGESNVLTVLLEAKQTLCFLESLMSDFRSTTLHSR